jgi:uncharacterized protein
MKRKLLDILACPVCKYHPLQLEAAVEDARDIVKGKLTCPRCRIDYPITDGIPDLVPPDTN